MNWKICEPRLKISGSAGCKISKMYFESSNEILKGSHVAVKKANGKWFYWEWNEIPTIKEELNQILAQGEEILERVNKLIESHPDIAVSY